MDKSSILETESKPFDAKNWFLNNILLIFVFTINGFFYFVMEMLLLRNFSDSLENIKYLYSADFFVWMIIVIVIMLFAVIINNFFVKLIKEQQSDKQKSILMVLRMVIVFVSSTIFYYLFLFKSINDGNEGYSIKLYLLSFAILLFLDFLISKIPFDRFTAYFRYVDYSKYKEALENEKKGKKEEKIDILKR